MQHLSSALLLNFAMVFTVCCFLSIALFLLYATRCDKRENVKGEAIPSIPRPHTNDYRATLHQANKKYPNQPYVVPFRDATMIIPASCVEELKNLPDTQLSPNGSMYDRFAIKWTQSGWVSRELAHSIKYDLKNELDLFFGSIQEDIQRAATQGLPESSDWTLLEPQIALVQIVAPVLGRIMVGSPLNQHKEWISASTDHATAVVMYAGWLRQFPSFLRPFVAPFMPWRRKVESSKTRIAAILRPILNRKFQECGQESKRHPGEEGRLARWLLKRYKPTENPGCSPATVLRDHYSLCFAAIHGPTFLLVQAIIDLASYPRYQQILRQELDATFGAAPFHRWTRAAIAELVALDAFCKESARMNPQGLIGWLRKTHRPISLSTGHVIPPDTLVATTNPLFDHEAVPWIENPQEFYPERWMANRSSPEQDAPFRFGSASIDSLIFGYGKHACPGRPLGTAMVKSILAFILKNWDIRIEGEKLGRPENIFMDFMVVPPIYPLGNLRLELKSRTCTA
ncbi:hypothetical protein N0V93_004590 [Gnomoniopsis smithogilvyi]|uniref:Cytochrome P450 n=1 Tax=Gnomoniopsis smithogilvyi TaxID=1191159 RepID=A0A9W8YSW2_9PEZI|nr:hypothetical protein N0V93_004590 [Gnomoniopsis smithogilvyi]